MQLKDPYTQEVQGISIEVPKKLKEITGLEWNPT
jgi:hypothetical protein